MPWARLPEDMRDETPLPEEYSRVTNPERFRALHSVMLDILSRQRRSLMSGARMGMGWTRSWSEIIPWLAPASDWRPPTRRPRL